MKGKKILIKLLAIVYSAMLLFLSPCARYIDAKSFDKVYAIAIAPALGGVAAVAGCEFLLAAFASIAVGEIVIEHPESLLSPFAVYAANNYGNSIDDACMNIYNKATGAIESISWSELIDSLSEAHDLTVDNLTDLYVQYCPALLESFDEFISDVIYGDIFVPGLSDVLADDTFQDYDSIKDISGNYVVTGYAYGMSSNGRDTIHYTYFGSPITKPFIIKNEHSLYFRRYTGDGVRHSSYSMYLGFEMYRSGKLDWSASNTGFTYIPFSGYGFNIPIFSSEQEFYAALESGDYSGALNYTDKTMESVIDLTLVPDLAPDIPPFTKSWQQKEWDRIANAPDVIGIGSYGHGVYEDNWGDDIPWIGLESLHEYSHSLLDNYNQIIDDILNGTYDSSENIPGTYSEAWEQAISEAWDNVEQSTDAVPGESEKDKPSDGEDEEKEDPKGGGGDSGDSNNEDNNDQKEPPEGEDDNDNTGNPNISKSALDHATKQHMPSKYALQLGHLSKEEVEAALEDLSFFNVNWTEEQVIEALTLGYEEALSNGYVSGKYTFTYLGETIIIALKNGVFKTGFGLHSYTYDELYELFLLLGGE